VSRDVRTLRSVYAAINRGDLAGVLELQAEDVEWLGPSAFPDLAEPHRGHAGVRAYAARVTEAWDRFRVTTERFIDLGERVLVLTREQARGRGSGVPVQSRGTAHLWTLRDGKVVNFQVYWDQEEGLRAAGLSSRGASPARP
jgi:ketosteroid isomerase-like protein